MRIYKLKIVGLAMGHRQSTPKELFLVIFCFTFSLTCQKLSPITIYYVGMQGTITLCKRLSLRRCMLWQRNETIFLYSRGSNGSKNIRIKTVLLMNIIKCVKYIVIYLKLFMSPLNTRFRF